MAKGKILQRLMLKDWCRRIGSEAIMTRFEAITCQWEKTKLIIFATRRVADDCYLVYKKGVFQFPTSPKHSGEFAQLILGVISLRRLVLRSYDCLNSVLQAKYREEIEMLHIDHEEEDDLEFRTDSTTAADDVVNAFDSSEMEPWLEKELVQLMDEIKYDVEDVKTYDDWEEFLMEKAKKRRVSSDE